MKVSIHIISNSMSTQVIAENYLIDIPESKDIIDNPIEQFLNGQYFNKIIQMMFQYLSSNTEYKKFKNETKIIDLNNYEYRVVGKTVFTMSTFIKENLLFLAFFQQQRFNKNKSPEIFEINVSSKEDFLNDIDVYYKWNDVFKSAISIAGYKALDYENDLNEYKLEKSDSTKYEYHTVPLFMENFIVYDMDKNVVCPCDFNVIMDTVEELSDDNSLCSFMAERILKSIY